MKGTIVYIILALGLLVTMMSGFYGRKYNSTTQTGTAYGLPIAWHGQQTSLPSSAPASGWFSWQNFIYDTALWSMIFGILALISRKSRQIPTMRKNTQQAPPK